MGNTPNRTVTVNMPNSMAFMFSGDIDVYVSEADRVDVLDYSLRDAGVGGSCIVFSAIRGQWLSFTMVNNSKA